VPTVIDSLIVELRLDPSGFTQGQRRYAQTLRDMESAAAKTAGSVSGTANKGIRDYLASFDQQFKEVNKRLTNLGAQTRRTGADVRAGGLAGAEGLTNLATAALGAYAALKSVQETIKGIGNAVGGAAQTGRAAFLTGVDPRWLQAFEQYANVTGNVPTATTEAALQEFEQKRAAYRNMGEYATEFTSLQRLGIDTSLPLPALLQQIAEKSQGLQGPDVQFWASRVGFGPLATTFSKGGAAMQGDVARRMQDSVLSPDTLTNLQKLQGAVNDVGIAFDVMINKAIGGHPEFGKFLTDVRNFINDIANTPSKLNAVTTAAEAVAVAIGITMAGAVIKLADSIIASSVRLAGNPLFLLLTAGIEAAKILTGGGPAPGNQERVEGWTAKLDPLYWIRRIFGGGSQGSPGPGATRLPGGGVEAPIGRGGSYMPPAGGSHEEMIRGAIAAAGGNAMAQAGLLSNFDYESGGLNPRAINSRSGATGWAQWISSTRPRALASFGDPLDPATQAKMLQWELSGPYHDTLMRMNAATTPQQAAEIGLKGYEGVTPANSDVAGAPWDVMLGTHIAKAAAYYQRAAAGAGGAPSGGNSTSNDIDINGGVHVYTSGPQDAHSIASGIGSALRHDNVLVNNSNTGLE
jgi:uncharacterized protein YukE